MPLIRTIVAPTGAGKTSYIGTVAGFCAPASQVELIDGDEVPAIKGVYMHMATHWGPNWWLRSVALREKDERMADVARTYDRMDCGDDLVLLTAELSFLFDPVRSRTLVPLQDVYSANHAARLAQGNSAQPILALHERLVICDQYRSEAAYRRIPVLTSWVEAHAWVFPEVRETLDIIELTRDQNTDGEVGQNP
jgi:hypothetical protein